MRKFPKVKRLSDRASDVLIDNSEVYILEKVDGANFRWKYHGENDEENFLTGSRNVVFSKNGSPLPLDEVNKNFRHVIKYLNEKVDVDALQELYSEYGELVFFGEAMHKHSIDYDEWDGRHPEIESNTPNFIGFDIWNEDEKEWLSHEKVIDIFREIGLKTVPVVHKISVEELNDSHLEIPSSEFREGDDEAEDEFDKFGLAEGIVIKNDSVKKRAKVVAENFREVNRQQDENNLSIDDLKEKGAYGRLFVDKFVTEQRIMKIAHKLVDIGKYDGIEMQMMEELPRRVIQDVFEEEGWNICMNEYGIEITEETKSEIRKMTSKKCSRVLKENMYK